MTMDPRKYEPGIKGWVGYQKRTYGEQIVHSWWFGPGHMFATLGALGPEVVVYPTRRDLVAAIRKHDVNVVPQKVVDAEALCLRRWVSWWERVCEEAEVRPDNRLPDRTLATRRQKRTGQGHPDHPERIGEWRERWAYARRQLPDTNKTVCR
jgi:hypothetical protein